MISRGRAFSLPGGVPSGLLASLNEWTRDGQIVVLRPHWSGGGEGVFSSGLHRQFFAGEFRHLLVVVPIHERRSPWLTLWVVWLALILLARAESPVIYRS